MSDPSVNGFAKDLMEEVINDGRKAALDGRPRSSNPHQLESCASAVRRTVWDAGWVYVAGLPKRSGDPTEADSQFEEYVDASGTKWFASGQESGFKLAANQLEKMSTKAWEEGREDEAKRLRELSKKLLSTETYVRLQAEAEQARDRLEALPVPAEFQT